jgi:hypothetical protein
VVMPRFAPTRGLTVLNPRPTPVGGLIVIKDNVIDHLCTDKLERGPGGALYLVDRDDNSVRAGWVGPGVKHRACRSKPRSAGQQTRFKATTELSRPSVEPRHLFPRPTALRLPAPSPPSPSYVQVIRSREYLDVLLQRCGLRHACPSRLAELGAEELHPVCMYALC